MKGIFKEEKFPPCNHCKEPIIKKNNVGSKEIHRFSVDSIERWFILRKNTGSKESTTTTLCATSKFY